LAGKEIRPTKKNQTVGRHSNAAEIEMPNYHHYSMPNLYILLLIMMKSGFNQTLWIRYKLITMKRDGDMVKNLLILGA
jgi:hypothetical protein